MKIEDIKQLIDLANETGLAELEVERNGERVRIRRAVAGTVQEYVVPAAPAAAMAQQSAPAAAPAPSPTASTGEDPALTYVKAPIVGTFYEAPSPDVPPFVKIGDQVQVGQVLCIIESMKLMNEIESEVSGVIVSRFVSNSQPTEYGQTLFAIRPL
ncbi:MAG: acetyl-CoA carboxylase biotin carboxyl carrier protein [Bryobacterales bacterium]|nr:acetyl-CoA carboxylase biotin carboxyl carrier protein [Bryobacterales bacterium]